MNRADAARLLSVAAVYDKRTIGETDAAAWADALGGLNPEDCVQAIREHYRDTDTWLMPAHIRARVKALANDRAMRRALPSHVPAPRDVAERYIAECREALKRKRETEGSS